MKRAAPPGSSFSESKRQKTETNSGAEEIKTPDDFYDRYSRQYYVIGAKAMTSLGKASVLVSGLGGLGVEIGK